MLLKNVDQSCRFPACGFLACGFLAWKFPDGCSSFICHEDSVRFSTLKTDGWACDAFSACKDWAATCGAELWALDTFTPQLHTLHMMKNWLEMKIGYKRAEPSELPVLNKLHVKSNSEHHQYLRSTLKLTLSIHLQVRHTCTLHMQWVRHGADTYS